jgi:hypothetical protein
VVRADRVVVETAGAMMHRLRLASLAGMLLLSGCALFGRDAGIRVEVAPGHVMTLVHPGPLGRHGGERLALTQLLAFQHDDNRFDGELAIEIDARTVRMVALAPWGGSLYAMLLDGARLTHQSSLGSPRGIRPEYIMTDFILTYWPEAQLRPLLAGGGLSVADQGTRREIRADGGPVITIDYTADDRLTGKATLVNHLRHYTLQIETLSVEAL